MRTTQLQRTIRHLQRDGFTVEPMRRTAGYRGRRYRPFGFIDLLCFRAGRPPLAVCLSIRTADELPLNCIRAELRTLLQRPEVLTWTTAGNELELWSWRKHSRRWTPNRIRVGSGDGESRSPFLQTSADQVRLK